MSGGTMVTLNQDREDQTKDDETGHVACTEVMRNTQNFDWEA